jgi:hypothetical protein
MYDKEKGEKRAHTVLLFFQSFETKVDEQHSNYTVPKVNTLLLYIESMLKRQTNIRT